MKLVEGFDSNYRYILVAARRARQLQNGASPSIDSLSRKPCRIAQDEVQAGKVKWLIPEPGTEITLAEAPASDAIPGALPDVYPGHVGEA